MTAVAKGKHPVVRRLTFRGLKISVETDKGQVRHWHNYATNERGETKMRYPYGYFEGTKASNVAGDGMALDVYVGPNTDAESVYVISQHKAPDFERFDELKVMLGFESEKRARVAYLVHYNDERFIGAMDTYTFDEFKEKFIQVDTPLDEAPALDKALGAPAMQQMMMPQVPTVQGGLMPAMMPMMQQGPPPIDVDTYDGVDAILGRVGNMKDNELLRVVEKVWGPGYQYVNATPDHVRAEVRNFLLDQRDLLAPLQALAVPPPTPASVGSSPASSAVVPSVTPPSPGTFPTSGGSSSSAS